MPSRRDPESLLPLGPVSLHILLSLADGPKHGYAVMKEVARVTEGKLKLGNATLYTAVKRLLDDGLIAESEERPAPALDDERRRYYALTPLGRSVAVADVRRLESTVRLAKALKLLGSSR